MFCVPATPNRIGFAPTTDGKIIFLLRFDGPRDGWTMFTDGTQQRLSDGNVEDWCCEDPAQTIEEVEREAAERLVAQNRA